MHPTKVLARFIAGLSSRSQPVLLDLGPVVGTNVSFFGEQLGCKIIVEDLSKDIDRHVRDGSLDQLPAFLMKRFPQESSSIDGILCWDVFDYLDNRRNRWPNSSFGCFGPTSAPRVFGTAQPQPEVGLSTRHVVVDKAKLQHRPCAAARPKRRCRTVTSSCCSSRSSCRAVSPQDESSRSPFPKAA